MYDCSDNIVDRRFAGAIVGHFYCASRELEGVSLEFSSTAMLVVGVVSTGIIILHVFQVLN